MERRRTQPAQAGQRATAGQALTQSDVGTLVVLAAGGLALAYAVVYLQKPNPYRRNVF
jgi:hypothetical protein